MNLLKELLNMSKVSVYGLVNESKKEVYLTYSTDSLSSLNRLIIENRNGLGSNIDLNQFEYKLFEEVSYNKELKFRFNYWYNYLKVNGYKLINKRKPVIYKLVSSIDVNKTVLYVKLKSRYSEVIVGVFDNIQDCNKFMNQYGDVHSIKLASNKLTKDYINGNNK